MRPVYVETLIDAPVDQVWALSQDPGAHQRWDARFTHIGAAGPAGQFRYATRLLPGLTIAGRGIATGRRRPGGSATSALRFTSTHRLSLIRTGSGYWRYVPTPAGIRFLTGYHYTPGWGTAGLVADRAFRPLIGWATAWSFDRFRIWLETGRSPERSQRQALAETAIRAGLVGIAIGLHRVAVLVPVALLVLLVPPLPGTPAARRCRRRAPDAADARPPAYLARLARP
jgi:hypothetical protein